MKIKKGIALFSAFILCIVLLGACTSDTPVDSGMSATTNTEGGGNGEKPLRVVALLNGTLGDRSFFDSANDGIYAAIEQYGIEGKVIEATYDTTKWEPALADLCDENWDIIVCGTWQMADLVKTYAAEYPEQKFILFDTDFEFDAGDYSNVYAMIYKQNEGSYLAGVLGALMTVSGEGTYNPEKVIGFVGGNDTAVINDFLVGYIAGAVDTDPEIKINVSYVYDFSDAGKAKELALAQFNRSTDIIFSVAATAGLGVLDAAKEKGLYAIGVDADQAALFAETDMEKAALIPSSMMKRVDMSILRAIEMEMQGTLPWGEEEYLGILEDCIGLAKNDIFDESVPQHVKDAIEDAQEKILSGEIKVDTAYGMETEEIKALIDSVKPAL